MLSLFSAWAFTSMVDSVILPALFSINRPKDGTLRTKDD